ncbi:MAG: hypothetical protein KAT68_11845 [Bacteroidales bacterium]|nr:hypothetical protein [Bacteroidales bacterium]
MKNIKNIHTFHIPVMGIGFTIDTPVKVAQYGISSVISLVDDMLFEKMREYYCKQLNISFKPITNINNDYRVKRITSYLNLIDKIVKDKFEEIKNSILEKSSELEKYMDMLPDFSVLKKEFEQIVQNNIYIKDIRNWIQNNLLVGSIDVNIMTKIDKENYNNGEKLSVEYNDAHAALCGFAKSNLESSIIFSAGMNQRLYSYIENFDDFYPDENGQLKKKITLKVSDYRSALIQGKFLAKKGLWISEFRIESGLNCGGHAFATNGCLMGPILEEFKNTRDILISTIHEIYVQALKDKNRTYPKEPLDVKITAQGGISTAEEHQFLIDYYQLDSIGWGTPFLLVPEVTNVDENSIKLLSKAGEDDLYLSNISPLSVPFNSLRNNTKDIEKTERIKKEIPGSPCPKHYLVSNKEFTDKEVCLASRQYQKLKIKELDTKDISPEEYKKQYDKIVDKSCLCVGLGTSSLIKKSLDTKIEGKGVSICPGPNMAYFSETVSLKEMTDHIYGRKNIIKEKYLPNMFIKELSIYIDYLKKKIDETQKPISKKEINFFNTFRKNLISGIKYYKNLFSNDMIKIHNIKNGAIKKLELFENELNTIKI